MAKSTRSKVKRHFRAKKREDSVYAATEAARLQRLNMKLRAVVAARREEAEENDEEGMAVEGEKEGAVDGQEPSVDNVDEADTMDLDSGASAQKVSTHGPRGSRREQWRQSKGLPARPKSKGMNRQGGIAAKRKAGRSHRRR